MTPLLVSAVKGTLNLVGFAMLVTAIEGFWDAKFLLEIVTLIVGIAITAAVMRSRVNTLETTVGVLKDDIKEVKKDNENWQEKYEDKHAQYLKEHNELHLKMSQMLSELLQKSKDQDRRVTELEAERWRALQRG